MYVGLYSYSPRFLATTLYYGGRLRTYLGRFARSKVLGVAPSAHCEAISMQYWPYFWLEAISCNILQYRAISCNIVQYRAISCNIVHVCVQYLRKFLEDLSLLYRGDTLF